MLRRRLLAVLVLLIGVGIGWWVYSSQMHGWKPFKLVLDLSGGTQLVYKADFSGNPNANVADSMASLRDTIERRVSVSASRSLSSRPSTEEVISPDSRRSASLLSFRG